MIFYSEVKGHEGPCKASWLNKNQIANRMDGGVTGFFRTVRRNRFGFWRRFGPQFHGIIKFGETTVESTANQGE